MMLYHCLFQSLCNWNSADPNSLLSVITELLQKYRQYHLSLLNGTLLEYEYNSLTDGSAANCHSEDVEIYVARQNGVCLLKTLLAEQLILCQLVGFKIY
jgi:hypothetical protein